MWKKIKDTWVKRIADKRQPWAYFGLAAITLIIGVVSWAVALELEFYEFAVTILFALVALAFAFWLQGKALSSAHRSNKALNDRLDYITDLLERSCPGVVAQVQAEREENEQKASGTNGE